ncbi:hypothetical protein [Paenibacillus camerounensis]|uniref:hypothetical protein n=1 Tax=Paenibacillus camerounensis TaxID=1243663 RepID=UPI0005AA1BE4|nr:hypothetical protein [Paenibacillus camerounensis]
MDRTGFHSGHQDIKGAAVSEEQLQAINVTDRVMARVRETGPGRRRGGIRFAGKTAATSGMLAVALLITATTYAASEYIQIRNKAGEVKIQHILKTEGERLQGASPYHDYAPKLMNIAEPGEQIVYFVRGEPINTGGSMLQFTHKQQRITEYSAFLDQMKAKSSPFILPETAGGYGFKYGEIQPLYPTKDVIDNDPVYQQALSELIGEAKKDKTRNLFMKVMPWTETGSLNAQYMKGGAFINLWAFMINGGNMMVPQKPADKAEKLKVDGREVIYNYIDYGPNSFFYLTWYNEPKDAYIQLNSWGDRVMNKEQLLKLAGELIKGGL